jgi:hypothetical protein
LDLPTKSEFVIFFANWLFKPILPFTHVNHEIELVSAIGPAGFILTHIPHERHDAKKIQKIYQLGVGLNPNSPSLLSWNLVLLVCLRSLAGDATMQIDHMQNHPEEAWRGGGIYVFFVHRKLFFQNVPIDCIILHFSMHDACVMSDVHVCRKCQKYVKSSTDVVVKPTCVKIYLRSQTDRVAAMAAPNKIT